MRSVSIGRNFEALNVTVPENWSGIMKWRSRFNFHKEGMALKMQLFRYWDITTEFEHKWIVVVENIDFVPDKIWVKSSLAKHLPGIVD